MQRLTGGAKVLRRLIPLMLLPLFLTTDGGAGGAADTDAKSGGGATPPKSDGKGGATPPAGTGDTSDEDKLASEAGKKVLREARDAQKAADARAAEAERQLKELQDATGSEHDKAINTAKREATAEANGRWANHVRTAVVEGALRGAGIVDDKALTLAMRHETFGTLKVDPDTGAVSGVTEAVDAFKTDYGQLFKSDDKKAPPPPPAGGTWDGGAGGQSGDKKAGNLEDAVLAHYQGQGR